MTSGQAPSLQTDLKRCPELWFDDGTIVIRAEDTLFRVYAGQLSRCSAVFKDTFSLPQPPLGDDANEVYEGTPLVVLNDSAADMEAFLLAIFDVQCCLKIEDNVVFDNICSFASILRISTKYEAAMIRSQVLRSCLKAFPYSWPTPKKSCFFLEGYLFTTNRAMCNSGKIFAFANVARETESNLLLPFLLFLCCRFELPLILDGAISSGEHAILNPENMRSVLVGRRVLEHHALTDLATKLSSHNADLPGHDDNFSTGIHCKNQLSGLMIARSSLARNLHFHDPLCPSPKYSSTDQAFRATMCNSCAKWADDTIELCKMDVWKELPIIFGLDCWSSLKKDYMQQVQEVWGGASCL
ncbi:hypothetical protein C8Q75DRAFT_397623 [Abortiporus biennis]|nr:hypothetical protein C8Q75DRAFT_397623 [Abortiporus biennis]